MSEAKAEKSYIFFRLDKNTVMPTLVKTSTVDAIIRDSRDMDWNY